MQVVKIILIGLEFDLKMLQSLKNSKAKQTLYFCLNVYTPVYTFCLCYLVYCFVRYVSILCYIIFVVDKNVTFYLKRDGMQFYSKYSL